MTMPFSYARFVNVCELRWSHFCVSGVAAAADAESPASASAGTGMGAVHVNVSESRGSLDACASSGEDEEDDCNEAALEVDEFHRRE